MEEHNEAVTMLQLMPQPAFRVEKGVISHVNHAAQAYFLQAGQRVDAMILTGAQEYAEFSQGSLYLTLSVCGRQVGACVIRLENADIFTLEQDAALPQLQGMALAAAQLRQPLAGLMCLAEQMLPAVCAEDAGFQSQAAQMNRRLYQMLRIVSNMSDAAACTEAQTGTMECTDLCAFTENILEKTAALAESAGIRLEYALPREAIYTLADEERLERAVYNILSNAIKFASAGSVIRAALTSKNQRLYFSVTNDHTGPQDNFCDRFLRQLSLEDPRSGVGLGMVLVRAAAAQHGGAVLVDRTEEGTRVTLTVSVRRPESTTLRSPIMRIDYAGEHDHGLMELADVLPAQAYGVDQIN